MIWNTETQHQYVRFHTRLYDHFYFVFMLFRVALDGLSKKGTGRSLDFYGRVLVSRIRIPVYQTFTTGRVFLVWYLLWGRGKLDLSLN